MTNRMLKPHKLNISKEKKTYPEFSESGVFSTLNDNHNLSQSSLKALGRYCSEGQEAVETLRLKAAVSLRVCLLLAAHKLQTPDVVY